jgi:hypothetical protein
MHVDHHAKLGTDRACREFTIPCYESHYPPPSTVLSAPLLHAKGYRKQADGTAHIPAYKRHAGVLSRSSTLESPSLVLVINDTKLLMLLYQVE